MSKEGFHTQVSTRVRLADVCTERAPALVTSQGEARDLGVAEVEVVVAGRVNAESRVILQWREIDGGTTLPTPDHARTGQLGRTVDRVRSEEVVELRHELLELAEGEERAVLHPRWT